MAELPEVLSSTAITKLVNQAEETEQTPEVTEKVLTDFDVYKSNRLQQLGALAGDKAIGDKLVRVVSEEPRGQILTKRDVVGSPRLQELGAEAGDMIEDGKLIKSGENDWIRNFVYNYTEAQSPLQNFGTYLQSKAPIGDFTFDLQDGLQYIPVDEEFMAMSPQERRDALLQERLAELEGMREDFEPTKQLAGQLAGSVDPTILTPLGSGLRTASAISGLLGGAYAASEDLAKTGTIDPTKTAIGAGLGAAAIPALSLTGRGIKKAYEVATKPAKAKVAKNKVDEVQAIINREVAQGTPKSSLPKIIEEETGLNQQQLAEAMSVSGVKTRIPKSQARAQELLDNQIAVDSATARTKSGILDKYLGTLSTRVKNISVPVFTRLRKYEADLHIETAKKMNRIEGFTKALLKAPPAMRDTLNRHLLNGDYKAAKQLMSTYSQKAGLYIDDVQKLLDEVYDEVVEAGYTSLPKKEAYFPRMVKDLDGLLNSLGKVKKDEYQKAIEAYAKRKNRPVSSITIEEKSDIINKMLRGYRQTTDKSPRWVKQRTVETVTPDMMKYYYTPAESLQYYLRGVVNDIQRRRFFGRAGENSDIGTLDLDASIGRFIAEAREAGQINGDDMAELGELLSSRFIGGERQMGDLMSWVRDTGYAGTIANPISAITQLGDLATSGAIYGLRNTLSAMFNPKQVKIIDLGLEDVITNEMMNPGKSANLLQKMFRYSGFQAIDRLGKESTINAALRRFQSMAKTEKGKNELRKKWGQTFGDDMESVIADLENKTVSENIKLLAFNVISDLQPITRSEMPQGYLDSVNGRMLYMLKSFTIKQYDIVRREIVQEYKKGNKKQAVKMAAMLGGYLMAANTGTQATKDILLGREVRVEDIPDRSMWALLGVYGGNKYMYERYLERGDVKGAAVNLLVPATPLVDAVFTLGKGLGEEDDRAMTQLRPLPVVGPIIYNWFGGGAEAYNERLSKE
jgi:hypothetical protein